MVFLVSSASAELVPKFHLAPACFSCSPCNMSVKITPSPVNSHLRLFCTLIIIWWSCCYLHAKYEHVSARSLLFSLPLPEVQAGIAWQTSESIKISAIPVTVVVSPTAPPPPSLFFRNSHTFERELRRTVEEMQRECHGEKWVALYFWRENYFKGPRLCSLVLLIRVE